ncbi:DUF1120 domain-containing protein [uncultured Pseudacidovorax sp.]|uniref:DUF1120 domain-containing protein n=1 Tax=uncultured Pseudacidovorax sp. TaxID=679313 RepID=UPI0025DFECD5|nr:DUF1120 domain-containing protein [uncultured Pseudacidovorax sp.]
MFKKAMIAGAVVLASVGANAATANLTVSGTITPEACAITLGSSGTVDYGALSAVTVKSYGVATSAYSAPPKTIALNVTCSAPTAVSLAWTDNRSSSVVNFDGVAANNTVRFGLGTSGTTNIGAYQLDFTGLQVSATASGTPAAPAGYLTRTTGTTGAWSAASGLTAQWVTPGLSLGMKTSATDATPPAISTISGNLSVYSYFSKALVDSATSAITLNGQSTVTLEYI